MENPTNSDPDRLTIVERPIVFWFFGAVFAGFGLVLMFIADAPRLMGAIFVLIGGIVLVMTPTTTVNIDRRAGTIVIQRQSLSSQRSEAFSLADLRGIKLQSSSGGAGRIVFVFRDRGEVPLTGYYSSGRKGKQRRVDQMRAFLDLVGDTAT
jgi:hypothetical protein